MSFRLTNVVGAVALGFASSFTPAARATDSAPKMTAVRDEAWDAAFTRSNGWTGADVAGSVALGGGRTLWLFGDTWIGSIADGHHVPGAKLVNNSIAVQVSNGRMNIAPGADALQFYWGSAGPQDAPTAWIVPDARIANRNSAPPGAKPESTWYWPTGGGALIDGSDGKRRLVIFYFHLGKRAGEHGIWNFQSVGSSLVLVDNFDEPPEKWRADSSIFRSRSAPPQRRTRTCARPVGAWQPSRKRRPRSQRRKPFTSTACAPSRLGIATCCWARFRRPHRTVRRMEVLRGRRPLVVRRTRCQSDRRPCAERTFDREDFSGKQIKLHHGSQRAAVGERRAGAHR